MVGPIVGPQLEDVLTRKQVDQIINKLNFGQEWRIVSSTVRHAIEGIAGFLADHLRVTLLVESGKAQQSIQLFLKRLPVNNQPKAEFITSSNYFKREELACRLVDEMRVPDDPHPWCPQPLVYNEFLIVMSDLAPLGYSVLPQLATLDLPHALASASSIARFHAATANHETKKRLTNPTWTFSNTYPEVCQEPTYTDTPFVHCGAKLIYNFIKIFSKKYRNIPNLESRIHKLFVEACDSVQEYDGTLNTLIHKDLWMNNIMFRYEKGVPVNAILIDYQLMRYAPPAFDLMHFLYLITTRQFREHYEKGILRHYFSEFLRNLEDCTKKRLNLLDYNENKFLQWCEKARLFGVMFALMNFPYVLMDSKTAQKTFDDPATYQKHFAEDRTDPVVAYCHENSLYRDRQLEVCEEFVERYLKVEP